MDETKTRIHIDASGVVDRQIDTPQNVRDVLAGVAFTFDPATGALWIVHYKDSVSRIDLAG
jgi:hypothetical protein